MKRLFYSFCCFVVALFTQDALYSQPVKSVLPPNLDRYINQVLEKFNVPGISLAIVKDGEVILTKGYGIKKMGNSDKVDECTLFPIASNSKAFTATALAILVERGLIQWNDKVIDHLPWFRMSDAYVTSEIRIKDLLVHNSGLAPYAGDLMQFPVTDFSRKEIVRQLKYLPLSNSFRAAYAYDNVLYLVAGELIEAVTGMSWEKFIQTEILNRLNMNKTLATFSDFEKQPNVAFSHIPDSDGKIAVLHNFFQEAMSDKSNPAGGIVSCALDMAKWMQVQLDSGMLHNNNRLFTASTTTLLWKGVTAMPEVTMPAWIGQASTSLNAYALGFYTYLNKGTKVVTHGGKLDGFVSCVRMYPEYKLGITILTNQESGNAYNAILNYIADFYLGRKSFDWLTAYRKLEDLKFSNFKKAENQSLGIRDSLSKPSLPLQKFSGIYKDAWYGNVIVSYKDGQLYMKFSRTPMLTGRLEHWQYNTFIARWDHREVRGDAFVTFSLDADGSIDAIKMKAVSSLTDVSLDFHDLLLKAVK